MTKFWRSDDFTSIIDLTCFPLLQRNNTKFLSFNLKKGMKLFSESLGSTWHQSKADLQLKEIHGFAIDKGRQIDLLLSDFSPQMLSLTNASGITTPYCIKMNDLCNIPLNLSKKVLGGYA